MAIESGNQGDGNKELTVSDIIKMWLNDEAKQPEAKELSEAELESLRKKDEETMEFWTGGRKTEVEMTEEEKKAKALEEAMKPRPLEAGVANTRAFTRYVMEHGLSETGNYQELNSEKVKVEPGKMLNAEANGLEAFKKVARSAIKRLVIHGIFRENKLTGEMELLQVSDSDGQALRKLMEMAGFDKKNGTVVEYVKPGESREGAFMGDTGHTDVKYDEMTKSYYLDHHSPLSKADTSATKYAYEVLTKSGLLEAQPYLDKAVDFITMMDNKAHYPQLHTQENYENSWKTPIGLYDQLSLDNLIYFFKGKRNPYNALINENNPRVEASNKDMLDFFSRGKKVNIRERMLEKKEKIKISKERVEQLKKDGYVVDTGEDRYGKVLVDIGGTVPDGADAAFAYDCDTYIKWLPEKHGFLINTLKKIKDDFGQGLIVREHVWLKPKDEVALSVGLGEILDKMMGDGKVAWVEGGLKDYLNKDKKTGKEEAVDLVSELPFGENPFDLSSLGLPGDNTENNEEKNNNDVELENNPFNLGSLEVPMSGDEIDENDSKEMAEKENVEVENDELAGLWVKPEPSVERENALENEGLTAENEERFINQEEKLYLERLEQEARIRQRQKIQELRNEQGLNELRAELVAEEKENNNKINMTNLLNGNLWKRAKKSVSDWFRKLLG